MTTDPLSYEDLDDRPEEVVNLIALDDAEQGVDILNDQPLTQEEINEEIPDDHGE